MMFDEEDDYAYDEYSDFEYLESSVSEAMRIVAWSVVATLIGVGFLLLVVL